MILLGGTLNTSLFYPGKPLNPQTLKPLNPQPLKPLNPQTLKHVNTQTYISHLLFLFESNTKDSIE